jgi:hypothetical protein
MKKVSRETQINVLKLFNVMVLDGSVEKTPDTSLLGEYGVVTDFVMKPAAANILKEVYAPLDARTLFGREERDVAPLYALLMKQFLHYVEVYGLDKPGLFDLEVNTGTIVKLRLVRGVTPNEFAEMVRKLLYANAPVSDAVMIKNMINEYSMRSLTRSVTYCLRAMTLFVTWFTRQPRTQCLLRARKLLKLSQSTSSATSSSMLTLFRFRRCLTDTSVLS